MSPLQIRLYSSDICLLRDVKVKLIPVQSDCTSLDFSCVAAVSRPWWRLVQPSRRTATLIQSYTWRWHDLSSITTEVDRFATFKLHVLKQGQKKPAASQISVTMKNSRRRVLQGSSGGVSSIKVAFGPVSLLLNHFYVNVSSTASYTSGAHKPDFCLCASVYSAVSSLIYVFL